MVAVDTETMGLRTHRDRLCVVQLSSGDGNAHLVQFQAGAGCHAPNLKRLMEDPKVLKLFHFARFDLAALKKYVGAAKTPVYCTRTASRSEEHTSELQSLMRISYAVFCFKTKIQPLQLITYDY